MDLIAKLIDQAIRDLHRREAMKGIPRYCEIEQHNARIWSVKFRSWIVFLDMKSGDPRAYHALPISVWDAKGENK